MKNKSLFLYMLPRLLATTLLLAASAAFAIDSDGDGVDDSVDAFPADPGGAVDTDSDGMPNEIIGGFLLDGFESGNFSANSWSNTSGWSASNTAPYQGTYSARQTIAGAGTSTDLTLTTNLPTPVTLTFVAKWETTVFGNFASWGFDVNRPAFSNSTPTPRADLGNGWFRYRLLLNSGTQTIHWEMHCTNASFGLGSTACNNKITTLQIDNIAQTALVEDTDDDSDGVLDIYDLHPTDNTQAGDYDNDGIEGLVDNCPSLSNATQANFDGDAQGDVCDADKDNDGVPDTTDAFDFNPTESVDTDNDGIGNNADWDDDNDGAPDTVDVAPLNASNASEIVLPLNNVYKGSELKSSAGSP